MAKSVQEQINAILSEYIETEREKIHEIAQECAEETVKLLKKTSPRSKNRGKHYASGWKVNSSSSAGYRYISSIVYNATKPQLTHLLTRPHDIVNQYGRYGRSTPDPHLEDAEQFGMELYLKRLEREL